MSRQAILTQFQRKAPLIAPSMLKCDFSNLRREVELLESAGASVLQWDVMDGHFVPNLSYGPMVIERVRPLTNLPFDAHLMIDNPEKYLDDYIRAGCDSISIHVEAVDDPRPLLRRMREANVLAGLALNPGTPVERIEPALPDCDLVLVMSVEPGFGGQAFMPSSVEKLRRLRKMIGPETILSIDGGIGPETIAQTSAAGADLFVVGSSVFDTKDYSAAIAELVEIAGRARRPLSSSER